MNMLFDLLGSYNPDKALDNSQAELTNMYLSADESVSGIKGEYKVIAYPTFGLSAFCTTGEAVVRALYEHADVLYVVAGNKFGSVNSSGTFTQLGGNLTTSTGFAKIVAITGGTNTNNQLVIIDGTNGYAYNIGTSTATFPIADADFPQTVTDVAAQDDYVFVQKPNSGIFNYSNLSDTTAWAALDFALKFRNADRLMSILSNKGELWLLGSKSIEVWTNTGDTALPFQRRSDVLINEGCASTRGAIIAANRIIYFGRSLNGGYKACGIDSYESKTISTRAIETQFNNLTAPSECILYSYFKDGHEFVDFTFPTDSKTFTIDLSMGVWIKKESLVSASYGRFIGNCSAFCYNKSLIGGFNTGIIYTQSASVYTENGVAIRRRFVSPTIYQEGKRIFIHRLQIDCQTNVGTGTFLLELSNDHGNTWETVGTYTVPTSGSGQIYTTSLGSGFSFMFRITTTDNFNFILLGFQAEASLGTN